MGEAGAVPSEGDKEILGSEPERSRGVLIAAAGILVVVLVAYAAPLAMSTRPEHHSQVFNMFSRVKSACDLDDGNLVTADPQGTPTAFATPDGPAHYWCVSRDYLTAIGHAAEDPPPPVREVPREYKWLWPQTSYGR
jgi:hypothetical protein